MAGSPAESEAGGLSLRRVQRINWLALGILTGAAWFWSSWLVARSVLVGGVLANVSFLLLQRDLLRLFGGDLAAVKARFFMRYYLRLAVVAVILFLLVYSRQVHVVGLLIGLSTVFLGIGATVAGAARGISTKMQ